MNYLDQECLRVLNVLVPSGQRVAMAPVNDPDVLAGLGPDPGFAIVDSDVAATAAVAAGLVPLAGPLAAVDPALHGALDVIISAGLLNEMDDVYATLEDLHGRCSATTRVIVSLMNRAWRPAFRVAELFGGRSRHDYNWLPPDEVVNLLEQSGFGVVSVRSSVVMPFRIPVLSRLMNRWLSPLPVVRLFGAVTHVVARPLPTTTDVPRRESVPTGAFPSVSVVVAARNEEGNIANLVARLPSMSHHQELIFVEGGSSDGTWSAICAHVTPPEHDAPTRISAFQQDGTGKGDAVRLGFAKATGDIIVILDADLSVPPEELPRFIDALTSGSCEFANGSRLVYPMEDQAMQYLNIAGNRLFGLAFTYLLGQPVRDTLCGSKALWRRDYERLASQRDYFGDFDPFGDFDLLFGAARMGLRIRDIPVHYKERVYGSTNISRFRHGLLLLRMTAFAARRLRFV